MTGQELFYALSFVDARYIHEAETARLGARIPWTKVLSVAACLCILLTGLYAYSLLQPKGEMEAAPEAAPQAAPEAAPEAAPDAAAPLAPEEEIFAESAAEESPAPGELQHVPFAQLRILKVQEDGSFEVFVERVAEEPGPFGAGVEMRFVIDPEMIPQSDRTDTAYDGTVIVDMLVEIRNGAYDAESNTLYAEGIFAAARE